MSLRWKMAHRFVEKIVDANTIINRSFIFATLPREMVRLLYSISIGEVVTIAGEELQERELG